MLEAVGAESCTYSLHCHRGWFSLMQDPGGKFLPVGGNDQWNPSTHSKKLGSVLGFVRSAAISPLLCAFPTANISSSAAFSSRVLMLYVCMPMRISEGCGHRAYLMLRKFIRGGEKTIVFCAVSSWLAAEDQALRLRINYSDVQSGANLSAIAPDSHPCIEGSLT